MNAKEPFGKYTKTLYTIASIWDVGEQLLKRKPTRWQRFKAFIRRLVR